MPLSRRDQEYVAHAACELRKGLQQGVDVGVVLRIDPTADEHDIVGFMRAALDDPIVERLGLTVIAPEDSTELPLDQSVPWQQLNQKGNPSET